MFFNEWSFLKCVILKKVIKNIFIQIMNYITFLEKIVFFFFHSFFLQIEKYHKKENAEKRKKTMKKIHRITNCVAKLDVHNQHKHKQSLLIFFSFINEMCFNLIEKQSCPSIQTKYFLSDGEMTLIFIVCESTESFLSPFLC